MPVDGNTPLIENAATAVSNGRIVAVGPRDAVSAQWQARESVDRPDGMLIPGLINAHTHAAMSLMRGVADDTPLETWLNDHIWPLEAEHVTAEMVRDGTRLAMAEMIRGGVTCFNDMYFFPDIVAEAASAARMRASVGLIVIEFETAWAASADEYLSKGMAVYDEFAANPLISMQFAPHSPYTVSEETLARIHTQADQLDIPVHTHLHETAGEIALQVESRGERPFAQLERLGMLNTGLLAVHMTQLTDNEIEAAGRARISVVHCPESNMKLASGIAPVAKLIAAGVCVALGTDGAASNNDLDMIGEMKTAALLGKIAANDASALSAHTVLEMATINGARALGIDDQTGSLEVGKWADIACIDFTGVHTAPIYDPVSTLVYSADRNDVRDVWVAGKPLLENRTLTTIDEAATLSRAREWGGRIANTDRKS